MPMLIHGENQVVGRQLLNQFIHSAKRAGIKDLVRIDGTKSDMTELQQALTTTSLFGTERLVVIENLHRNRSKIFLISAVELISSQKQDQLKHVCIWEGKNLTPTQLKKFTGWDIKACKPSSFVFPLLESIGNSNLSHTLKLLHQSIDTDSAEFVFFMLARHIRQLIQVSDDMLKAAPWQIGKLKKQLDNISLEKLISIHQQLLQIDYQSKTSQTQVSLSHHLELLLIKTYSKTSQTTKHY